MNNWVFNIPGLAIALFGYLAIQVGIGYVASRFIKTEADYLLAGRSLGLFLSTFSLFATWFGAETVIGSSGAIAEHGLSGSRADPFGYTLCLILMGVLLAGVLRTRNYVTLGDLFREQYGRKTEVLGSLIMIPPSLIWGAAQIQAFALILSLTSDIPIEWGLIIAVIAVIVYTCIGGLMADVITDFLQGLVVIAGLTLLLGFVLWQAGGVTSALGLIQPEQLHMLSPNESWLSQLNIWAIPILGSLVAPEAATRMLSAKTPKVARDACLWAALIYGLVGLMPVVIALIGTHLITVDTHRDMFLPQLALKMLPPWAAVIFLGALVSAILSTINSTLLSISGLVSHNLMGTGAAHRDTHEAVKVRQARWVVVIAGIASYTIAIYGKNIYSLVETASSFGSAGFLVCVLGGLFLPGISARGVCVILVAGVVLSVLFGFVVPLEADYLCTVLVCVLCYLGFWLFRNSPPFERGESR